MFAFYSTAIYRVIKLSSLAEWGLQKSPAVNETCKTEGEMLEKISSIYTVYCTHIYSKRLIAW